MIKKFFSRLKKNTEFKKAESEISEEIYTIEKNDNTENNEIKEDTKIEENTNTIEKIEISEDIKKEIDEAAIIDNTEIVENIEKTEKYKEEYNINIEDNELKGSDNDKDNILNAKIKRAKGIKAIDVYTEEEQIFKTYKACSKKIKVSEDYIIENLKFGYTDYLGEAIKYLSFELEGNENFNYLESNKTPLESFNYLHEKIFTAKISQNKREEVLLSEKIDPIKMHYKFETIDYEYDEYFEKYKSIIKRGGKKKIELVDKKGEVVDIFKSLEECAKHLKKDKQEVADMLKYMENKVGRYEIRYSLRNI